MKLVKKRPINAFALSLWLGVLFLMSSPKNAGAQAPRARSVVAYSSLSTQYAPVWVAKEIGYFDRNGLAVDLVFVRGGVIATQALISGQARFISSGGGALVDAVFAGADTVALASPTTQSDGVLVTKKEITRLSQLRGKTIGVNSIVGPAMIALKIILKSANLDPDRDVKYLAVGSSASRITALRSGNVDGSIISPPFTLHARQAGYTFFDGTAVPALKGIHMPNATIIGRRKMTDAEPRVTEGFVKSVIEAIHFIKRNKAPTMAILGKYQRLENAEEIEEAYSQYVDGFAEKPYPSAEAMRTALESSRRPEAKTADPSMFIDGRFVSQFDKHGFIDSLYKSY